MNLIDLWKSAPPAAPETPALKALRMRSMGWCVAAVSALLAEPALTRAWPALVLLVLGVVLQAIVATGRYWIVKERIDREYADDLVAGYQAEREAEEAAAAVAAAEEEAREEKRTPRPEPELVAALNRRNAGGAAGEPGR